MLVHFTLFCCWDASSVWIISKYNHGFSKQIPILRTTIILIGHPAWMRLGGSLSSMTCCRVCIQTYHNFFVPNVNKIWIFSISYVPAFSVMCLTFISDLHQYCLFHFTKILIKCTGLYYYWQGANTFKFSELPSHRKYCFTFASLLRVDRGIKLAVFYSLSALIIYIVALQHFSICPKLCAWQISEVKN